MDEPTTALAPAPVPGAPGTFDDLLQAIATMSVLLTNALAQLQGQRVDQAQLELALAQIRANTVALQALVK